MGIEVTGVNTGRVSEISEPGAVSVGVSDLRVFSPESCSGPAMEEGIPRAMRLGVAGRLSPTPTSENVSNPSVVCTPCTGADLVVDGSRLRKLYGSMVW